MFVLALAFEPMRALLKYVGRLPLCELQSILKVVGSY